MAEWRKRQDVSWRTVGLGLFTAAVAAGWFALDWRAGLAAEAVAAGVVYAYWRLEWSEWRIWRRRVAGLSYRVRKAGEEAFNGLPVGIVLYDESGRIEWHNPFFRRMTGEESAVGRYLSEWFPALRLKKDRDEVVVLPLSDRVYEAHLRPSRRLVYFFDVTERAVLQKKMEEERLGVGIVMIDNLDEASQSMDDQTRSMLTAKVTGEITNWAAKYGMLLRRMSSDRFLVLFTQRTLQALEQSRFDILDHVRELTAGQKVPLTLSIGLAIGFDGLPELGQMAQTSLDMALGRGGDQAAVRIGERYFFYGGKTGAIERRTRVRARVVAHALRDLVRDSENVIIMGHRLADMDALGAAIGMRRAVRELNKEAYIVLESVNPSIERLMDRVRREEGLIGWFIGPDEAMGIATPLSLVVVVDTHRTSMVVEPRLLRQTSRVAVIDHHRRGEDFIADPTVVYQEPHASSTCELVAELLPYFHDRVSLTVLEATALLAGIVVDTKQFTLRTGARTFEAASFLRRHGADPALAREWLREDLSEFLEKAELIRNTVILYDRFALAVADPDRSYSQLVIAQAADTLLEMGGVEASFVAAERPDGKIGISARSTGSVNVQLIMERMGGGGHFTNAAAQVDGPLEKVAGRLREVLNEFAGEEGFGE